MGEQIISGSGTQFPLAVDSDNAAFVKIIGSGGQAIGVISGGIIPVDTNLLLTTTFASSANSQPEYQGWTIPGQGAWTGSPVWRIQKIGYDSSLITSGLAWASGNTQFDKVWDDRGTYTYS